MSKTKIKILAVVGNLGAVAQVRIISPLEHLREKGFVEYKVVDLSKEEDNPISYVPDIVIIQRLNQISYLSFFKLLKSKGSKIICELDDNLLELPVKNPAYKLFADANQKRGFLEFIWLADHLIVSTEELKNYYSQFNTNITVVPNQIDEQIFLNKAISNTSLSHLRIGFAGTTTHKEDFGQVEDAIKEIQIKYQDKIKLVFLNMIPDSFVTDNSVEFIPGTGSLKEFAKKLKEANLDIGLAPLVSNKFNLAKSDIKFLEYAISGIAGIYSNFGPYSKTIADYENGLLVKGERSEYWFEKIAYLLDNPKEIDRIKLNAFKYVKNQRTIKLNYTNWLNVFNQVIERKLKINNKVSNEKLNQLQFSDETNNYSKASPKVSIIILTHNQKKYTQECIESIYQNSKTNFELIIIDNNSTDETTEYLENIQTKNINVKAIFNSENKGFPEGINQGILEAKTDNIIIANNDIVFTKGWLERMIEVAESDDKIGIVGPISNAVSGVQLDKNAKYDSIEQMHKYSEKVSQQNKGQIEEFPRVAFLCTLIKKEVIDKIGGLDERFSPGNFEDDDFCLRAQLAGYKTVIAKDVFIHHYGSVSFKGNGEKEYGQRLKINEQKFIEKWGVNPEGVWLKSEKIKERSIKYAINSNRFIKSIERAFDDIDNNEIEAALKNVKIALENFEKCERTGYENLTKEDLLNIAGTLSLSKNQLEEAKMYFEQQLENNPNSSTACFGLGEIFNNANMHNESKTMYEWAIVNDTSNNNAKIRLKEINEKLNLPENHNSLLEEEKVGAENNA